jgi:hypothetical protein
MSLTRNKKRPSPLRTSPTSSLLIAIAAIAFISASVLFLTTRKAESKTKDASTPVKTYANALRADRMKHPAARSLNLAPLPSAPIFATITVDRLDDSLTATACTPAANDCSLRGATIFANANPGTTINLPAGTYQLTTDGSAEIGFCLDENSGDLNIAGNNTSIVGAGAATTIIRQTTPNDRVLCVDANLAGNFNFNISGVTVTGGRETNGVGGGGMISGGFGDTTTVTDCVFRNNTATGGGSPVGGAIGNGAGTLNVSGSTFTSNTATGSGGAIYQDSFGVGTFSLANSTIGGNVSTTGNGGGVAVLGGGTRTVTSDSFEGNHANGPGSGGGGLFNQSGSGTVSLNSFSGNTADAAGGGIANSGGSLTINYNRIANNSAITGSGFANVSGVALANDNWWGCNSGPGGTCNTASGTPVASWLILRNLPNNSTPCAGQATALIADIKGRNSGPALTNELNGLVPIPFSPTTIFSNAVNGTLSSASTQFINGVATATFTAGATLGAASADATLDSETATASLTVNTTTTSDPADQTVCAGTNANFSTTGTGTNLHYAWTVDGSAFGGDTASISVPTGSLSAGAHTVTVTTTGDCGSASQSATLTVQANTTATTPADQAVCAGTNATFSTTATGDNLHYAWTVDGSAFGGDTSSITVTTGSLSAGSHPVTVTVTGSCGTVVRNANLTVQANTTATVPADQTVCAGTNATFSTTATGDNIHYAWTVDGSAFGGDTSSITVPTGSVTPGSHPVTVTVTGSCGTVVRNANLTVQANTTATVPADQTVCAGTDATFSTTATGDNLHYAWTVDGSAFGGDTSSITVPTGSVTPGSHPVTVTVTGSCGTAVRNATLTVQENTTATVPADQTVCAGTNATFSTTATGTNLHFAWTVDGSAFGGDTSSITVPTGSLSASSHPVTVTVTGSCGTVVRNANLTVQANTTATTPGNQIVCPGANATFATTATGTNIHYSWTVDGSPFGGDTSSITVPTGSLAAGNHPVTVTVNGSCGTEVRNSTLTVQANTTATTPGDQIVCKGATANFSTTATGTNLHYAWTVDGSAFGGDTASISVPTASLAIGNHPVAVTVTGSCGTIVRNSTLTVNAATTTTDPPDVSLCAGGTASFSTTAAGTGPFTFVWKKGATVLHTGDLGGRVTISGSGANSTLTIANTVTSDTGAYTVEATGSCNTATQTANLSVNASNPTITLSNLTIFFDELTIVFNNNNVIINGQSYPFNGIFFSFGNRSFSFSGSTLTVNVGGFSTSYTISGKTLTLWNPGHQYQTVKVADLVQAAADSCDAGVNLNSVVIAQVTSDEVDNNSGGSDGNTINDIVIAPGCKSVNLRAERDSSANGRVYTITFRVRNSSGVTSTVQSKILIPKNIATPVVDSGAHLTVNSSCP